MRRRSMIIATVIVGLACLGAAPDALAATGGLAGVHSAGLVQDGRQLRWTLTFDHGFSRHGIASRARQACLLLQRRRSRAVVDSVCLTTTRSHGLSLVRATWTGGAPGTSRALTGSVIRHGADALTASFTPTALGLPYRSLHWQVLSTATGHACRAAPRARHIACVDLYPSRRHPLAALHTPRLAGCVAKGPSLVYGGSPGRREVALTFDDGPWWQPPPIDFVSELKRLGAVGTFFEIGDQIGTYDPTGVAERAMLADGDMIGDHTWTHPDMESLPPARQTSELALTADAIRRATGFTPCLWRPPYGTVDASLESLARALGFLTIYWNDDPRDWALPGTGAIVDTALREARNGGIIEMHFGGGPRTETLAALPAIVSALRSRGYRFVNLVQMLGLREIWR